MRRQFWLELIIVLGLTLLALTVRFYWLQELPPGLHGDEAAYGLDALDVLSGRFSIFFERNYGREPLFIYLQAISIALLGATPFALRVTSAIVGTLTVPAIYWMVKEAFAGTRSDVRWLALWTALFVAFSYWHLDFSRIGYRAILLPLLASVAFAWFWRAWWKMERGEKFPWGNLILCGIFVGGCLYTYIAGRVVPILIVVVAFVGALLARRSRTQFKRIVLAVVVIGISALVVFAPLGSYFLTHPESFFGRAEDVSVFSPERNQGDVFGTLLTSVTTTAKMFAIAGDPNWRHNPAGRPVLDPLLALWLVAGLVLAIARWRSLSYLFTLAWFIIFSLPAVLTASGLPHSLRALGMIPAAYLLPVLAMLAGGERLTGQWRRLALWLPLPFLLLSGATSLQDYFTAWERNKVPGYAFHTIFAETAEVMNQRGRADGVWIIPISRSFFAPGVTNYTIDFLHRGPAVHGVVLINEVEVPKQLQKLTQGRNHAYLIHWHDVTQLPEGAFVYADPKRLLGFLLNKHGRILGEDVTSGMTYATYELPVSSDYRVATSFASLDISFGGKVKLTRVAYGHTTTRRDEPADALEEKWLPSGHTAWVALRWQAQVPIDIDLKTTLYLLDENGHLAGQVDDLLVSDRYPFSRIWEAGEPADTWHILPTLPAIPPGRYNLYLGVYEDKTLQRYYVIDPKDASGSPAFLLGSLEITRPLDPPKVTPTHSLPPDTALAPGLFLLGYDLPIPAISPGDKLPLTLYWQARATPLADYVVNVELRDKADRIMAKRQSCPADGRHPTTKWQADDVWRDWHDLSISTTMPAGDYRLVVALSEGMRTVGQIVLGNVQVQGRPRQFSAPNIQNPMRLQLGTQIAFLGYDLESDRVQPGSTLKLTLYWQALDNIIKSYTVFTHLLGPDNRLWGQQDSPPGKGTLPTTGWVPGEFITDFYEIQVKPDTPPGEYWILVGMYDAITGTRLSVTDTSSQPQGDRILLVKPIRVVR